MTSQIIFRPDRSSGLQCRSHGELGSDHLQRNCPLIQPCRVIQWRQGVGGNGHLAWTRSYGITLESIQQCTALQKFLCHDNYWMTEMSFQWFGNLVTMRWWNDLWLNEGFATYVSYLGADRAEPDWNMVSCWTPLVEKLYPSWGFTCWIHSLDLFLKCAGVSQVLTKCRNHCCWKMCPVMPQNWRQKCLCVFSRKI